MADHSKVAHWPYRYMGRGNHVALYTNTAPRFTSHTHYCPPGVAMGFPFGTNQRAESWPTANQGSNWGIHSKSGVDVQYNNMIDMKWNIGRREIGRCRFMC